jgi:hypothetical protein
VIKFQKDLEMLPGINTEAYARIRSEHVKVFFSISIPSKRV